MSSLLRGSISASPGQLERYRTSSSWWLVCALIGCGEAEQTLDKPGGWFDGDWMMGPNTFEPRRFVDVTSEAGIDYEHAPDYLLCGSCAPSQVMTGGAAAADYDADGFVDLFVTRLDAPDILYRNRGDGTFEDVTADVGLEETSRSNGALWGDVDNDGDLDLFVTVVELLPEELGQHRFQLYINEGGHFSEQAQERGVSRAGGQVHRGWSAALGDYDRDGFLDLHLTEWLPNGAIPEGRLVDSNARLFRNLGAATPGFFEDVTEQAGVVQDVHPSGVYSFASSFTDLDDDGWPDLAVAADFGSSRLFWNNGDGTFSDGTSQSGVGMDENGMGSALGDFDLDGDLDWFVTSIWCPGECPSALPETGVGTTGNRLYVNQGGRRFSDGTDAAGVRAGHWGWGAQFFDYDNDRDLDLIMTNGYTFPADFYEPFYDDPMVFWENDGSGGMIERSGDLGVTGRASGKGLLVFDYDNDGDQDVFVVNNTGPSQLLLNEGGGQHDWLKVRLHGTLSNSHGVGARIHVDVDGQSAQLVRELRAGGQFLGQNELLAHFGLGKVARRIDRVRVSWPSGITQTLTNVAPNQLLEITEQD